MGNIQLILTVWTLKSISCHACEASLVCEWCFMRPGEQSCLLPSKGPEDSPCLNQNVFLVVWISVTNACTQLFWRLYLRALHTWQTVHIDKGKACKNTYIFIAFLLFQVAVCETSPAFSVRNKLAERSQRINSQQRAIRKCKQVNSMSSMWSQNTQCIQAVHKKRSSL